MMRSVDFGRQKTNPRILKGAREPTANLNSGHIHGEGRLSRSPQIHP